LRQCIDSIQRRSTYRNFELIVVDNDSREPATLRYLDSLSAQVLRYPREFNFSKIVNFAAGEAEGEMLLFLNNDTEVISGEWIEAMLEHAQRPEVAAVGARLLFPDGSPQHEGIIVGPGRGLAENAVRGGYFGLDRCIHNTSAVTGACMMTKREVFWELGGFEEQLQVAYNDVDFCLRAREKGYVVVYTPYATLYHDEGSTRARLGPAQPEADAELFRQRWAGYRDPYYNPNLDLDNLYALKLEV
jgi:GT2 family glycosyltransferase